LQILKLKFHKLIKILVEFTVKSTCIVSCASSVYLWLHIQTLVNVVSVLVWRGDVPTPDQHNNNINKGLYMQPQIHTACTRDYSVEQIFSETRLNNILIIL